MRPLALLVALAAALLAAAPAAAGTPPAALADLSVAGQPAAGQVQPGVPLATRFVEEIEAAALGAGPPPVRVALLPLAAPAGAGGSGGAAAAEAGALAALAAALPAALDEALAARPLLTRAPGEVEARLTGLEPGAWGAAAGAAGVDLVVAPRLWIGTPGWDAPRPAPADGDRADLRTVGASVVILAGEARLASLPDVSIRLAAAARAAEVLAVVEPRADAVPFALVEVGSLGPLAGPVLAAALSAPAGRLEGGQLVVLLPDALHVYRIDAAAGRLTRADARPLPPPPAAARRPRHPIGSLALLPGKPQVALLRTADRAEAMRVEIAADGSIGPVEGTGEDLFPLGVLAPATGGEEPVVIAARLEAGTTRFAPELVFLPDGWQRGSRSRLASTTRRSRRDAVGEPFVAAAAWAAGDGLRLALVGPDGTLRLLASAAAGAAAGSTAAAPAAAVTGVGAALAVVPGTPGAHSLPGSPAGLPAPSGAPGGRCETDLLSGRDPRAACAGSPSSRPDGATTEPGCPGSPRSEAPWGGLAWGATDGVAEAGCPPSGALAAKGVPGRPAWLLAASAASAPGEADRLTLFAPGPAGLVSLWRSGPRPSAIEALAAGPGGLLVIIERRGDGGVAALRLSVP